MPSEPGLSSTATSLTLTSVVTLTSLPSTTMPAPPSWLPSITVRPAPTEPCPMTVNGFPDADGLVVRAFVQNGDCVAGVRLVHRVLDRLARVGLHRAVVHRVGPVIAGRGDVAGLRRDRRGRRGKREGPGAGQYGEAGNPDSAVECGERHVPPWASTTRAATYRIVRSPGIRERRVAAIINMTPPKINAAATAASFQTRAPLAAIGCSPPAGTVRSAMTRVNF